MTKEEYMALAMSKYEELEALKEKDSFYDYEKGLFDIMQELTREYLEEALKEMSITTDRRKKKLSPDLEK